MNTYDSFIDYLKRKFDYEDEVVDWKSSGYTKTLAIFISLGLLNNGYINVVYQDLQYYMAARLELNYFESWFVNGLVSSTFNLGFIFGILGFYFVMKNQGRVRSSFIIDCIMIFGTIFTMIPNFYVIIIGRGIQGIAGGGNAYLIPIYLKEIAPKERRGFIMGISSVASSIGMTISYIVDIGLPVPVDVDRNYNDTSSDYWVFEFGVPLIFCFIRIIAINWYFKYETPVFIYKEKKKNKATKTKKALEKIIKEGMIPEYMEDIVCQSSECKNLHYPTMAEVFGFAYARAMILITFLSIFNIASGGFPIVGFVLGFIQNPDSLIKDSRSARGLAVIAGASLILSSLVNIVVTDFLGRRPLLIFGSFTVSISLLIIGLGFEYSLFNLRLTFLYFYFFFYNLSFGSAYYTYAAEVLPEIGLNFILIFLNFLSYFQQTFFNITVTVFGQGNLMITYSAFSFLGFFFIIAFIPEVKRKSFSQLFDAFHKENWELTKRKGRELNHNDSRIST